MKYTRIKISLGNRSDSNCVCECPIGHDFDREFPTSDINVVYKRAATYNDSRKCGCKCEVREVLE